MRVLIAGCGYVGVCAAELLLAKGHEVYALKRTDGGVPEGAQAIVADLLNPDSLTQLPEGIDAVLYTVAAAGSDEAAYRAAYVDGQRNLHAALRHCSPKVSRFIFSSSTSVYAQSDGSWVDEGSGTEPSGFRGRIMLEGERLAHAAPWTTTVLRFGGIYGPGRTRLLRLVESGAARSDATFTNRMHRDDCAGALVHLLSLEDPQEVYIGVDRAPATRREVYEWIAEQLGCASPPVFSEVPAGKRCRSDRLASSGFQWRVPSYVQGYSALIEAEMGSS